MATFQVPQFIEKKASIIGSLSIIQFAYIGIAGFIIYILYYVFSLFVWTLISLPIAGIACFFAFARINGQESYKIVQGFLKFLIGAKTFVWQRKFNKESNSNSKTKENSLEKIRSAMHLQEKIKSISLKISTGSFFSNEKNKEEDNKKYETVTFSSGEKKLVKRVDY